MNPIDVLQASIRSWRFSVSMVKLKKDMQEQYACMVKDGILSQEQLDSTIEDTINLIKRKRMELINDEQS